MKANAKKCDCFLKSIQMAHTLGSVILLIEITTSYCNGRQNDPS